MTLQIPKSTYEKAIILCKKNSERLHDISVKLFKKEQYLASFLIGLASWEEIGKALIVVKYWDRDFISQRIWKNELKSHKEKIKIARRYRDISLFESSSQTSVFAQMIVDGIVELKDDMEHIRRVVKMRTDSLYVNYDWDNNKWEKPVCDNEILEVSAVDALLMIKECMRGLNLELKRKGMYF